MIIDTTFDFTTDTDGYWPNKEIDPDIYSPTLRKYHQILWSRTLPNGEKLQLNIGENPAYDYLYWKNIRFGSDSIINMYSYHKNPYTQDLISKLKSEGLDFDKVEEDYLRKSYTIGGSIIFPKHPYSINQCRGTNKQIKDRFDLTLECIRRFYNNEQSPLSEVLEKDRDFFSLFVNFKGYVDFFFLQDIVSNNYQKVLFFLPFQNFNRDPYPLNTVEWHQLYEAQMSFLANRNNRIKLFVNNS